MDSEELLDNITKKIRETPNDVLLEQLFPDHELHEKIRRYVFDNIDNVMNKLLQNFYEYNIRVICDDDYLYDKAEFYEEILPQDEFYALQKYWFDKAKREGIKLGDEQGWEKHMMFYFNNVKFLVFEIHGQGTFSGIKICNPDERIEEYIN